ncbi:MAG: Rpn family recombination-promoting nuclease/putative transposase [Ardenticatenaceae bacterium]
MPTELRNPHDRFFKEVFSRPEVAQDFLQNYLPEGVAALLAPVPPQLRPGSFVDEALQEHLSDLLYEVRLQGEEAAYVYVLFEHKSYPEPLITFQLLRYMVRIWERDLREAGRSDLRPILPLVLYHGRAVWQIPRTFGALFSGPELLRPYWPEFSYHLTDLTAFRDEEIKGAVVVRVVALVFKYLHDRALGTRLPDILLTLRELASQETGLEFLETLLRYLSATADQVTEEELRRAVTTAFADRGGTQMATLAEKWFGQGLEQGRREGLLAGIQLGLELRFGAEGLRLLPEIATIEEVGVLRAIHAALKTAGHPDDLRRLYR